jgi:hypothetical protein
MCISPCFVGKHVIDWHFRHNEPSVTKPAVFYAVRNYLPCICIHFFVCFPCLGCHHLVSAFPHLLFVQHLQLLCPQKNCMVTLMSCLLYPWFAILFLLCLCLQILPDVLVLAFNIPSWNLRFLWLWKFKLSPSELLHCADGSGFQRNMLSPPP